jgi:glycine hydroxymethyltransferase
MKLVVHRYYGGNEVIDEIERLCQKRALQAFNLDEREWAVNVQLLSGSVANLAVYQAVLKPQTGRLMGLALADGGHLTHGHRGARGQRMTASSKFYETQAYHVDIESGLIDYDALERAASEFRPQLVVGGGSAYPREVDYRRLRGVCDGVGALLLSDMAHTAGLVAARVIASPFEHADIVTTTTHKTLRGPRGALIFSRKRPHAALAADAKETTLDKRIDAAVFPGLLGGPHNNIIAAIAVCLGEAMTPEFATYQHAVRDNARELARALQLLCAYPLVTRGTDTHLILVDTLRSPMKVDGARVDIALDRCGIACNRNAVPGDTRPLVPSGVRFGRCLCVFWCLLKCSLMSGTPAMTSRGLTRDDMRKVAELIHRGIAIASEVADNCTDTRLSAFTATLESSKVFAYETARLRRDVEEFVRDRPMP